MSCCTSTHAHACVKLLLYEHSKLWCCLRKEGRRTWSPHCTQVCWFLMIYMVHNYYALEKVSNPNYVIYYDFSHAKSIFKQEICHKIIYVNVGISQNLLSHLLYPVGKVTSSSLVHICSFVLWVCFVIISCRFQRKRKEWRVMNPLFHTCYHQTKITNA